MKKIEHIGIAVKNLDNSDELFSKLFGTASYKSEVVKSEGVKITFFKIGNQKIELLEAITDDSVIAKFIDKRGEGVHHIAFEVENMEVEVKRLTQEGFTFLCDKPKEGADNKLVIFLNPKTTHGVLIELCQEISLK